MLYIKAYKTTLTPLAAMTETVAMNALSANKSKASANFLLKPQRKKVRDLPGRPKRKVSRRPRPPRNLENLAGMKNHQIGSFSFACKIDQLRFLWIKYA